MTGGQSNNRSYLYPPATPQGRMGLPPPPPPPPPPPGSSASPTVGTANTFAYGYGYSYGYNYGNPQRTPASSLNSGMSQSHNSPNEISTTPNICSSTKENKKQSKTNTKKRTWFCDACDLTLDSQQAMKSHKKSHVKCTECSFEGAPKIVKGHYQAVHGRFSGSGFKTVSVSIPGCRTQRFKICVGNRKEDIQRWIAERKKRFPRQQQESNDQPETKVPTDAATHIGASKEKGNTGLSSLLAGYGSSSGSEDNDSVGAPKETTQAKSDEKDVSQSMEIKSDERNTEFNYDDKNNNKEEKARQQRSMRPCRYFMRNGTCLNGDKCKYSHEMTKRSSTSSSMTRKRKRGSTSTDTLLRKLLENDVQREATLTLQLLRYIMDCNFYESQTTPSANT